MAGFMDMGLQGVKALFFTATAGAIVVASGNLFIGGDEVTLNGTAPTGQIVMQNATIPDATTDGLIFLGAKDASSDAASTLSLYTEQAVETVSDATSDRYLRIWVNGESYKMLLKDDN